MVSSNNLANLGVPLLNHQSSNAYDDDIDDIMASIMQGKKVPSSPAPASKSPQKTQPPKPEVPSFSQPRSEEATVVQSADTKPKRRFPTKIALSFAAFGAVMVGGFFLWNGPISALLTPPSPFSQEIVSKMDTPLFYPTKLPGAYKMETNSITQPESAVVVYAITDDAGNKINVSLQKQPKGLTLEPLYKVLSNLKEVQTKFGTLKYGTSEDGVDIINVLTGNTWIIVTTEKGLLSDQDIQLLVNNLRTS